jgi:hypothetical protein
MRYFFAPFCKQENVGKNKLQKIQAIKNRQKLALILLYNLLLLTKIYLF